MKQKKYTKRALCMSLLSMLLCCSMLIGTTFAWFTDSVTSGKNKIVAGNLDVELEYTHTPANAESWKTVKDAEDLFDPDALWEPGHTEVVYLRITNKGTLALTYKFGVNVFAEKEGVNVDGESFKLSEHLVYKHTKVGATITAYESREDARADAGETLGLKSVSEENKPLMPGVTEYGALVVYMPTTVGNEANYRGDVIPEISMGVSLYATQYTSESDSFGNDYDKDAEAEIDRTTIEVGGELLSVSQTFADSIETNTIGKVNALTAICADDLLALSAMDQAEMISHAEGLSATITIGADIDMSGKEWVPINGQFTNVEGNGHTISNLNCAQGSVGKSGFLSYGGGAVIEDLTLRNVTASGAQVGAFVGAAEGTTIKNCKLEGTVELTWAQNTTSVYQEEYGSIGLIMGNSNSHSSIEVDITNLESYTLNENGLNSKLEGAYSKEYQPYVQYASGDVDLKVIGIKVAIENGENLPETLPDNSIVSGQGAENTTVVVEGSGSNGYVIKQSEDSTTTFRDLTIDGEGVAKGAVVYYNSGSLTMEDVVITGGGQSTWDASIEVAGKATDLIVRGAKISGAFRGILAESTGANVLVENCDIDATYPVNFDGGKGTLTVRNSTFHGWTSYGSACAGATFENVTFIKGSTRYNNVRGYVDTVFNGCTFGDGFWFGANNNAMEVHFDNCKLVDGTPITADNVETVLESTDNNNTTVFVNGVEVQVTF